jgi:hypothetical protein
MKKIYWLLFFVVVISSFATICCESSESHLLFYSVRHDDWNRYPTPEEIQNIIDEIRQVLLKQVPNNASWTKVRMRFEPCRGMLSDHSGFAVNIVYAGKRDYSWETQLERQIWRLKMANGFSLNLNRSYGLEDWPYRKNAGWIEVPNTLCQ